MSAILTTASTVLCPYGGQALLTTTNTDMLVDGAPVLLLTDLHAIVGCPFAPVVPTPCVTLRWVTGALQTSARGVPVLLQESVGLCLNAVQAPQGVAIVVQARQKAKGI